MRKTGLIMEGGAMRGMFTSGVMDVLMEHEICFDGAAGISAGAVFGCNFKSKQIGRPIRYNKRYARDPRYCSIRSLIKTGDLYGADFCYRELPDILDPFDTETFRSNPMEFYVGATNVRTGREEFHLCTDGGKTDTAWMRASASMPLVSRPVGINGEFYLDGGIACAVPYRYLEEQGYRRNVIILTQPKGFQKTKVKGASILKTLLHHYPEVAAAMEIRHEMYNRQMAEIQSREEQGISLVIRPPELLGISRTEKNPDELERVYQIGRAEAEKKLEEIIRFIQP